MGEYVGEGVRKFKPDDDEFSFYVECPSLGDTFDLETIIEMAQRKWPGISIADIEISAEHIQTDCLGHDLTEPSDYKCFLYISKRPDLRIVE